MFGRGAARSVQHSFYSKTKLAVGVGASLGLGWWLQKNYFANAPEENGQIALSTKEFRSFRLDSIEYYNHNTNIFNVRLPENQESGLTTASYLLIRGTDKDGKPAVKPYTPINDLHTTGSCSLLIKEYPEGNVSRYVHGLKVGDMVDIKGPFKSLNYSPNMKSHIGMIAGGTGITPMVQMLKTIFSNPEDKTKVSMIFANIAEEDILLREYLTQLSKSHPDRFKVYYTLDKPPTNWNGGSGFVSKEMVSQQIPPPNSDVLVLFCGPPPMLSAVAGPKAKDWSQGEVGGVLKDLGYTSDMVYKF